MYKRNIILISIGNELLNGRTLNTNFQYLGRFFTKNGFNVKLQLVLPDNERMIINSIKPLMGKNNIIFITGGLGPTDDDKTIKAISKLLNSKLVMNNELKEKLSSIYDNKKIINKQATVIEDATVLENKAGIAPGLYINKNRTKIFLLPGVPQEVKYIMENEIKKFLIFDKNKNIFFYLAGINESNIYTILSAHIDKSILKKIIFLPSYNGVEIILDKSQLNKDSIIFLRRKIKSLLNEYIISNNTKFLPELIRDIFLTKRLTLSIAESCTGGLVSKLLTDYSGSSKYFKGSMIVYSNEIKINKLKVKKSTIEKYGAVSENTAREMAQNIRKLYKTDYGISITGIAGPTGGSANKPVGLVYFGICSNKHTKTIKHIFKCNRECIRHLSAQYILFYLYKGVLNE